MSQRLALLRLIAVATEEHLPLSPLLDAWAVDQGGVQGRRVQRLSLLVKEGTPLPDAVEQVPGVLRDEDVLAIRFGAQSGTLAASLRDSIDQLSQQSRGRMPTFRATLLYGATVGVVFLLISIFIYIKIIPDINAILEDFDLPQPRPLTWSVRLALLMERFWWLAALVLLVLLWSAFSAWPGRFFRDAVVGRWFRSLRELRAADVLAKLSLAATAGRPISGALSTLARYHFDPLMRHKLLLARNEVEQGADVWQTLAAAGMLTPPEERLLSMADRFGNRAWTLRQLAEGKKRRTRRWLGWVSELALPALVFLLGAFVLFQALSLFVPLARIVSEQL
jgi:general secretion pathway protein F